jgi:(E)-4-hydroxy-3-methylbut-2-enyl-diphosphate synthase
MTMTNTPHVGRAATIDQIRRCEDAGADLIRVSCPDEESTAAHEARSCAPPACRSSRTSISTISARSKRQMPGAACLRINPGNIGSASA